MTDPMVVAAAVSSASLALQIARVRNHAPRFNVDVELERAVSGRLYLDVMLSRRKVQRTLRIVELVNAACHDAVNGDARIAGRDREADAAITLSGREGQRPDGIVPVVPRTVERVVEGVSEEDPEANAEPRTEPEPVPEVVTEMAVVELPTSAIATEAAVIVAFGAAMESASARTMEAAAMEASAAAMESATTAVAALSLNRRRTEGQGK